MRQLYNQLTQPRTKKYSAIFLGLEASGKSGLIQQLATGTLGQTTPTLDPVEHQIGIGPLLLQTTDVGGQPQSRAKWSQYAKDKQIIIFVINTLEQELIEAKKYFGQLMADKNPLNCIALILINKLDLGMERVSVTDAVEGLELSKFKGFRIGIFGTSAVTGFGISEAKDWLISATADLTPLNNNQCFVRKMINIGFNTTDLAINKSFEIGGKVLGKLWKSEEAQKAELNARYQKLAAARTQLLYKLQQEKALMKNLQGSLSQGDSEQLIEKYDREAHDLYTQMTKIERLKQNGSR